MASRPGISQALLAKSRCEFGIRIQFPQTVENFQAMLTLSVDFAAKVMKDQITYGDAKGSMKTSPNLEQTLGQLKHLIGS